MKEINIYRILILLLPCVCATGFAQTGQDYYYYKGEKIYLEINTQYIFVSGENQQEIEGFTTRNASKSSKTKEDRMHITLKKVKGLKANDRDSFWKEIELQSYIKNRYRTELERLRKQHPKLIIAPYFISKEGKKMGLSNYFYVKLKSKEDYNTLEEYALKKGVKIIGYNKFMPLWFTLSVTPKTSNAMQMANRFYESGLFDHAEPDLMVDVRLNSNTNTLKKKVSDMLTPNDPLYNDQWGLNNTEENDGEVGIDINAEDAWNTTTGNFNIRVAVLDHGFEMDHPDLDDNVFETGYDTGSDTSPAQVLGSHGTACAGIVAAEGNNGIGVSGVAPDASLVSVSSSLALTPNIRQELANGINWAWQNGSDIISNSWGHNALVSDLIDNAITNALQDGRDGLGTVVVFAAGNNNGAVLYPANSNPDILSVGAMSPCGERKSLNSCDDENWWGSNFGQALDIVAPGVLIATTDRQGRDGYDIGDYELTFNGTSSACPFVAGVAALVLSVNPDLTVQEVNTIVEETAQKVGNYNYANNAQRPNGTWNNEMGYGLVDAHAAVLLAQSSGCQDNLSVTDNVNSGETDTQQAAITLTATNTISSGGVASYDSGTRVRLLSGFKAMNGSSFRAFIEGCSNTTAPLQVPSNEEVIYYSTNTKDESGALNTSKEIADEGIRIYPNPTQGTLNLTFLGEIPATATVQMYDMIGNLVYSQQITKNTLADHQLDISRLQSGIYFIKILNEKQVLVSSKIIKQ